MTESSRRPRPVVLGLAGVLSAGLGLAALIVQSVRWASGSSNFVASSVAMVAGLMFLTFGVVALVTAYRMRSSK